MSALLASLMLAGIVVPERTDPAALPCDDLCSIQKVLAREIVTALNKSSSVEFFEAQKKYDFDLRGAENVADIVECKTTDVYPHSTGVFVAYVDCVEEFNPVMQVAIEVDEKRVKRVGLSRYVYVNMGPVNIVTPEDPS